VRVSATPAESWELALRVPAWSARFTVTVNGERIQAAEQDGYVRLRRRWQTGDEVVLGLDLTPRLTVPHPRIDAVRGCVALERGPLVYCIEQADQDAAVDDLRLDPGVPVTPSGEVAGSVTLRAGAVHAQAGGQAGEWPYRPADADGNGAPTAGELTAIPYAWWGNRTPGPMRVWIPLAS